MSDFEGLDVQERDEKAALYVMGELGEGERRAFEAEMAQSAELLQMVRELEEGATVVGVGCPPRKAPPFMWERIERTVNEERRSRKIVPLFGSWGEVWRNAGWAAAACLAAWMFFGVYRSETDARRSEDDLAAANGASAVTTNFVVSANAIGSDGQKVVEAKKDVAVKETQRGDTEKLRADLENLQRQVGAMSQMITQQQAMLGEPNRFKFLTLASTANAAPINGLSPQLQRALFLAMARELGWLNASNDVMHGPFEDRVRSAGTNALNVDFVDFRNTNGGPVRFKAQREKEKEPVETQTAETSNDAASTQLASLASAVPAFASADHVVMAVDPSIVATGSEVVVGLNMGGHIEFVGSAVMGNNPMVITFQANGLADGAGTLQLNLLRGGSSNLIEFVPLVVRAWNPAAGSANGLKIEPTP